MTRGWDQLVRKQAWRPPSRQPLCPNSNMRRILTNEDFSGALLQGFGGGKKDGLGFSKLPCLNVG